MFGFEFQAWKLNTAYEYLSFFMMFLVGAAILYFASKQIIKRRTDAHAAKKVSSMLKLKAPSKIYNNITIKDFEKELHYDHLLIDKAGIVAIRSIGWGIKVYGSAESPVWKVADTKEKREMNNPLTELTDTFEPLRRYLSHQGIYNVNIEPLIVFCDPFAVPELYLGRDHSCIILDQLKSWKKHRSLKSGNTASAQNMPRIIECLDKSL